MHRIILAAAAALTLGACATQTAANTAPPADRDCFRNDDVTNYGVVDDRHVRVTVGANRRYILTTLFNTRELNWTHRIALRSTAGWVCTGSSPGVDVIGGDPPRTFPVSAVERAPDEPAPTGS